jgi:formylglycine-generating enzyme required for sulfatase activity
VSFSLNAVAAAAVLTLPFPRLGAKVYGERSDTIEAALWASGAEPFGVTTLTAPPSGMILVPASKFQMGSTDDELFAALVSCQREPGGQRCEAAVFADETPIHTVTLSAYWLDRTEVTVAEYDRCASMGRCRPLELGQGASRFDRPSYPASLVTWDEARTYCEVRGARLPTEAEFERAARGPGGRRFPWGDLYNSRAANHGRLAWDPTDANDGFSELSPVGAFPSGGTPDGFLDLAGNVGEWVSDRYAPRYPTEPVLDPAGPEAASATPARVVRGGSYESAAPWLRGAARSGAEPSTRRPWIGFRCARSARSVGPARWRP